MIKPFDFAQEDNDGVLDFMCVSLSEVEDLLSDKSLDSDQGDIGCELTAKQCY
ncbi:hypothetical protein [Flavobacterium sp. FlaQc-50]|uniref:hypothetical protein n=1 Tax=unclassified Flavobacterium TaxID=196869 RepID=UPI0037574548